THGLREAVREEISTKGRTPLAENLRSDPELVQRFYQEPLVIAAQLAQGEDRYTALRLISQRLYTVFRRNERPDSPILFKEAADLARWRERGAIEFLAEVGRPFEEGYRIDQFLVDLDPIHNFPLEKLKALAGEVHRRLAAHEWVEE